MIEQAHQDSLAAIRTDSAPVNRFNYNALPKSQMRQDAQEREDEERRNDPVGFFQRMHLARLDQMYTDGRKGDEVPSAVADRRDRAECEAFAEDSNRTSVDRNDALYSRLDEAFEWEKDKQPRLSLAVPHSITARPF
jgi:hypothetical protein